MDDAAEADPDKGREMTWTRTAMTGSRKRLKRVLGSGGSLRLAVRWLTKYLQNKNKIKKYLMST